MHLNRRNFLKTKGAVLTLPFMPSLLHADEKATNGATPSKKLMLMYIPNGIVRRCFFPGEEEAELPSFIGGFNADKTKKERRLENVPGIYPLELTSTMEPLKDVAKDITMVTGLERSYKNGQDVHAQGASCYLTSLSPMQAQEQGIQHPNGRSLDQVIGDAIGHSTIFNTLEVSCNGFRAPKEPIEFDNISWYGPGKIAPSIREPQKLYDRLFLRDSYRDHVANVTDLVLADANSLSRKLASKDRETLGEFMEMIRGIELRIEKMDKLLADIDIDIPKTEVLPRGEYIRLQADLVLLAFQMGITNVSTFMIGPERWDATLMYEGVFDKPVQHHNMTHNQKGNGYKELQKIDIFHMEQYAYVIRRMKEIKESDGSSMLDNSVISYGAGLGDGSTHQYYDLPMVVAGGAQGQIKQGRFIRLKSGTLNSNLWLTYAQLMGLDIDSFADSTGVINDLWT
ncbi:MAG TPA: hypothetical protein DCP67_03735 [Planctomycetaceae bacterium]|jgi:hypothetical protein|nr:DUF1552 domain-containing protein [Pirellulales bacterium]HAL12902.1 hypothetical protein [Planctomycetaceae bacterium]HCK72894.1 hypothetical protein [Planctomycetaceae bacterium]|tara:strand:- start:671 stop:2035 length:1365 start_codon:yes stop_codon:yes gene_type:complete